MKKLFLFCSICLSIVLISCGQNYTKFVSPTLDGTYYLDAEGIDNVILVVKDGYLFGAFKDTISYETRLESVNVKFFPYDSLGSINASKFFEKLGHNYRCKSKLIATNKNISYYVIIYGKKNDCWYKFD